MALPPDGIDVIPLREENICKIIERGTGKHTREELEYKLAEDLRLNQVTVFAFLDPDVSNFVIDNDTLQIWSAWTNVPVTEIERILERIHQI